MMQIVGVTMNVMSLEEQAQKCLEAIGLFCRSHIANKIPGQVIRLRMLEDNDQHSMFSVNGDGEVWYLPGDSDTGYYFDHAKKDNIFRHWEEAMPLIENWPAVKDCLGRQVAASAADTNSIMHFQV